MDTELRHQEYRDTVKAPLLINSCENDPTFPQDAQAKADELLGGGKFAPGYERTYWDGCTHGFAVRGDLVSRRVHRIAVSRRSLCNGCFVQSNPKIKAGKEGAFEAAIKFFNKHL